MEDRRRANACLRQIIDLDCCDMNSVPPSDFPGKTATLSPQHDIPVIDVRQLIGSGREVILLHLGEAYRLRITARDRLILTK